MFTVFNFQISFPFQGLFLWAETLYCNAFLVCYSVDRRADTIYLQTDAIAIRWEKGKETITMFYRKHRQVLRRKIPNISLQGNVSLASVSKHIASKTSNLVNVSSTVVTIIQHHLNNYYFWFNIINIINIINTINLIPASSSSQIVNLL